MKDVRITSTGGTNMIDVCHVCAALWVSSMRGEWKRGGGRTVWMSGHVDLNYPGNLSLFKSVVNTVSQHINNVVVSH